MGDTTENQISAKEMAEIDNALAGMQRAQSADPLERSYAVTLDIQTRALNGEFQDGISDTEAERYNAERQVLDTELSQLANRHRNILSEQTDPDTTEIVTPFDIATANIPRPEESMRNAQTRNETVLSRLTQNVPALNGFDLEDAIALASGGSAETATREKFKDADPNILMATAYIMLDTRRADMAAIDPEFAAANQDTDFLDMASVNIFYVAENDASYNSWNYDRQDAFIAAVVNNPEITSRLEEIRSPVNLSTREEIERQYTVRAELTDMMATEYARAYGLENFNADDMFFAHKSIDEFIMDTSLAVAYASTVGVENDEAILVNYHPLADLIRTHPSKGGNGLNDESSTNAFLRTTIEELQHTADNIYGDRLLNGELSPEHPAFDHTSLYVLNTMNYVRTDTAGQANYEAQHVERTAKSDADTIAFEITFQINEREQNPEGTEPPAGPSEDVQTPLQTPAAPLAPTAPKP